MSDEVVTCPICKYSDTPNKFWRSKYLSDVMMYQRIDDSLWIDKAKGKVLHACPKCGISFVEVSQDENSKG